MQRKLELKLELSESDVWRLGGELPVGDLSVGPAATRKLRTVYFDTSKYDLHAAGISLRLRGQNGGWLQTVKADRHVADAVSNPVELEAPVAGEEPDPAKIANKKIKRVIQKAVQGTHCIPRFIEVQKQPDTGIDAARAAAYTIGRHGAEVAHVWREARKAWKDLERSPRFWA
jgi:inorganic triphosphatase YgiF